MKNKRFFRKFLVLAAVMFSMTAFSVTAYAGGGRTPACRNTPAANGNHTGARPSHPGGQSVPGR
jgi:hypothetical protein